MKALGIDIGGTGIKGAVVDTKKGHLITDRLRLLTPEPATPEAVAATVASVARHFEWDGPDRVHVPRRGEGRPRPHRGQPRQGLDRPRRRRPASATPPAARSRS